MTKRDTEYAMMRHALMAGWTASGDPEPRQHPERPLALPDDWIVEPPRNLGRFNCRGDYVLDGEKIQAERLGIRPAYGPVDEAMLRSVGELGVNPQRSPPYMFRGEPCANVGQLRLLLEAECGMARSDHLTVTECAVFLRDALRRVMFTCAQGRDGVVTVDPRWAEG